jgi:ubiquitin carboxyl-terminal hydrolase 4/11/15
MTIADSGYMMENESIGLPYTPEEEKRIVEELAETSMKEGDVYFVLSNRWFTEWQKYVGQVGVIPFDDISSVSHALVADRPGPIDNTNLVSNENESDADDPQILKTVEEGQDYVFVCHEVWKKLFEWYKGGPPLPRKVIAVGDNRKPVVEVHPLCLQLIDSRDNTKSTIRLSKKDTLCKLHERVFAVGGIEHEKARIWDYFNDTKQVLLTDSNKTLEDAHIQMDQSILLEVQEDGSWPAGQGRDSTGNELALVSMEPSRSTVTIAGGPSLYNGYSGGYSLSLYNENNSTSSLTDMEDGFDSLRPSYKIDKGGLAGLQNLGNTCFMNSALQCLVHTPALAEYFLQDYSDEINTDNPLGMHGELALAFGDLLRKLWTSGRTAIAPRAFKGKLARFAPFFTGYNQHDSQELLAFLLDGLHEDLNRVKQKPYIEAKDYDGRPDDEVADECWMYHKARNNSVIVDVCQGQYKSTLVCPECNKISITFDPFMYLSLPLPSTATRSITVTVFYSDGSGLPMPYTVSVLKQGAAKDLTIALSTACCLKDDETLLIAEVYDHGLYRYIDTLEPLSTVKDNEHLVAYRLPRKYATSTRLEIYHSHMVMERKSFLTPLVTYIEESKTGADVDLAVNRVLSPLKRKSLFPSPKSNGHDENGILTASDVVIEESTSNSVNVADLEDSSSKGFSFSLSLSEDRGTRSKPLVRDTLIKPGRTVKVVMGWSDKEHQLYDASYLKDLPEVYKVGPSVKKSKQEAISLFSCLDAFLKEEPLGPDDMWYCPHCKKHRQATKKLDLWRLPEVVVIHLKRFSFSRFFKNKLDTFVNFPVPNLDLSKYIKNSAPGSHTYELYAISNHYGGLGGGHYSAYAKLIDENRWYHFDDAHVSPVSEADIKTSAAYLLFYKKVKSESTASAEEASSDVSDS